MAYEYSCREDGYIQLQGLYCQNGCSDGVCINLNPEILTINRPNTTAGVESDSYAVTSNSAENVTPTEEEDTSPVEDTNSSLTEEENDTTIEIDSSDEECEPEYFCAVEPATCPSNGLQIEYCSDFKCKTSGTEKTISCTPDTCSGCKLNETCLPYGFRTKVDSKKLYCDIDSELKEQKIKDIEGNWAECQNNFECESNLCTEEECVDIQAVVGEANKFRQIFFPVFCKLIHPINEDEYNSCLINYLGNNL
jgi:hypothetical protein